MTTRIYNRAKEKENLNGIVVIGMEDGGIEHKEITERFESSKIPTKIKLGDIFPQLARLSANGSNIT